MKIQFYRRVFFSFFFLLSLFFLIQSLSFYLLKKPFVQSSLLAILVISPLSYFFFKFIIQPIKALTHRIITINFKKESRGKWGDEFEIILKSIEEMRIELQRRIEEISREKDYLHNLLDGLTEGILIVDARGRIRKTNHAFREFFSLSQRVENRPLLEVIRNVELEKTFQEVLKTGRPETLEISIPLPGKKIFEVNMVRIYSRLEENPGEEETSSSVLAVFHDITRLKELEKVRQDFVANVSHELRTPLATIKGYAETLLEGALKEEVAHQFVQVIKKHSDRLEKIVDDLLMISKIESQEFQWKKEVLSISELIEEALELLKDSFEKKNMRVSLTPIPTDLQIYGDRKYLEQVLFNLLDNAIKYGREDGMVSISVTEKDQKEVEVSITDDGIGIPGEDLPRIFERFYRVDKGRSRELGGTGLGLSIVKHIIQAHGGRVWAESVSGKGSTFHFTLPIINLN